MYVVDISMFLKKSISSQRSCHPTIKTKYTLNDLTSTRTINSKPDKKTDQVECVGNQIMNNR